MQSTLYIVEVDKSFTEYTKILEQLIIDQGVEVKHITFDEYQIMKPLSDIVYDDAKFIFIGTNSWGQSTVSSVSSWRYEQYGCRIGWKGKKCVILANDTDLPYSDYKVFREYCIGLQLKYPDVVIPPESVIAEGFEAVKEFFDNKNNHSVYRAQYSTLIHEFMDSYFDEFINYDNGCKNSTGDTEVSPDIKTILGNLKHRALDSLTRKQALLCHAIIHPTALGCSAVAFLPIPVVDTLPITSAQVAMVLGLSKVFDNKLTKSDAQILLKIAAAPLTGRALAKTVLVFVPGVGWAINGAIAGIITEILGWTIVIDFVTKSKARHK